MRGEGFKLATVAMSLGLVTAACTSSDSGPATAPSVTEPPVTAPTTTSPLSNTVTSLASTTTVDRIAEVEAIFKDLELRRLDALFREDEEAFRRLFARPEYLEISLETLGTVKPIAAPTSDNTAISLQEVLVDRDDCLAASLFRDFTDLLGPEAVGDSGITVIEPTDDGWGYAFVGEGWLCDGPYPELG